MSDGYAAWSGASVSYGECSGAYPPRVGPSTRAAADEKDGRSGRGTRRQKSKETKKQGDKAARRQGRNEERMRREEGATRRETGANDDWHGGFWI